MLERNRGSARYPCTLTHDRVWTARRRPFVRKGSPMSLPDAATATPPPREPPESIPAAPPRAAFTAAGATAIVAAVALSWDRPGIGLAADRGRRARRGSGGHAERRGAEVGRPWSGRAAVRAGWAVAAGTLLAVGAVRAAGWLFVLCVLTAGLVGCVALTDRWSVGGMLLAPLRIVGSVPAALRWLVRGGIRARGQDHGRVVRTLVAGLIAVALLVVFGFLLVGADAVFAAVLSTMVSFGRRRRSWPGGWWSAAARRRGYRDRGPCSADRHDRARGSARLGLVRRVEWALPVGGLVTLFAGFVTVQATSPVRRR